MYIKNYNIYLTEMYCKLNCDNVHNLLSLSIFNEQDLSINMLTVGETKVFSKWWLLCSSLNFDSQKTETKLFCTAYIYFTKSQWKT